MNFGFVDVLITISVLIVMLLPGYILRKLKMVHKISVASLVVLLLYCCQPFLTMKAFVLSDVTPSLDLGLNMLIMLALSLVSHIILFFVAKPFFMRIKDREKSSVYSFATVFSNSGFVGIPFVAMLTNSAIATLYATIYVVAFNMLIWTLGVYIITGDRASIRPLKAIFNPAVVVIFVAVPMFFFPSINIFKLNKTVGTIVSYFGDMTTPLSMIIVGIRLADIPLRDIFCNVAVYVTSFMKLILAPLVILLLCLPLLLTGVLDVVDPNNHMITVLLILVAIPPAASMIAFCEKFRGDVDTAVKAFMCGTILSIITLPLILSAMMYIVKLASG